MRLNVKFDINLICKKVLQEQLDKENIAFTTIGFGEVEVKEELSNEKLEELKVALVDYGIEIVESNKSIIVQKIKDAIIEMVYLEDKLPTSKISNYLAEKIGFSYGYISNLFSDVTYTSIENFIIIQRIEYAKQLITIDELSFTEISYKLNYCNLAHFCTQFKNTTGLTPTVFKRIINQRKSLLTAN
ncbi:MAG: AraC family transcriptional regulator [Bacteroidota bacterium]